jgi:hypothetical protein
MKDLLLMLHRMALAKEQLGVENQWLKVVDVGIAIDSVTLAITLANEPEHGYSYFSSEHVEVFSEAVETNDLTMMNFMEANAVPGFGPMLLALRRLNHIMLLIVQLDEHSNPELLILDSRAWYWSEMGKQSR